MIGWQRQVCTAARATAVAAGVVSLRSVAVTVLLASDQASLELTAYTRNEHVLL
jgi:hypothetical protein